MKQSSSYTVEIKQLNVKALRDTIAVYNNAISFLIDVVEKEWSEMSKIESVLSQKSFVEKETHSTKTRTAKYDFDSAFPYFPSYLRRAAIAYAIGHVSSHHSNLETWEKNGKKGKAPTLSTKCHTLPTFYKDNMYKVKDSVTMIKLFVNNGWHFIPVSMKKTDQVYIAKHMSHASISAPTLVKKYKKWFLRFCFEEQVELNKKTIEEQKICSVDLGLNTDAVCSIMDSNGIVLVRKFIDFPGDKNRYYTCLNRIKKIQQAYCSKNAASLWKYATRLNDEHAKKVARAIVDFAIWNNADCIVFEYLDMKGKKRGSKKQRLATWRKNGIQKYAECDAHRHGIHISRICAWGTSKLAFDGSGEVKRNEHNHSLCTFSNGKQYNCDLSASYNIGARYFIREKLKSFSEKKRSCIQAKVPDCKRRIENTLDTLLRLNQTLATI